MAKRSRQSIFVEAASYLDACTAALNGADGYHKKAVVLDLKISDEYNRPWRDDLVILELKDERDRLLMQADNLRRSAAKALRKHISLMRKARWARD